MKVVITSNYPLSNETGASKVAELLSEYLSIKNEVVLICIGEKYSERKASKKLTIVTIPMIDFNYFQMPVITPIEIYKIFNFLDKFKPNIIHAQNTVLVSKLAQVWANINNVPYVITYHHVPTEAVYHIAPSLAKNKLGKIVQKIYKNTSLKNTLNNSDGVIALNKKIKDSVRTVNKKIKIEIINNGIETKELEKLKTKRPSKEKFNFIFLGSFSERKNQLYLLRVFKNLNYNYQLNLYGNKKTGGDYLTKLEKYVKGNKIKNVNIYDFTNDIISAFDKNDFLLSASKKEAQSLVILQAMAAGKPVIGLENESIDELVNSTNGLKVKKNTNPKLFANILEDFTKKCNYIELSKRIRLDSKKFSIEKTILKIEDFYKTICNSYSNNSRRNIGKYYNEILKKISIIQK